jgi:glycosyltransferase involved in cell wall biosynthesis
LTRIGLDYWPAVTHAPGVGRHVRELVRALVRLPDVPELALLEVGPGPRVMREPDLGLAGASVVRRRARIPRSTLRLAFRATGRGAERWLGAVDLFQRAFAEHPPVARGVPQVLPLAELPPPGSTSDRRLRSALATIGDVIVFSAHGAERAAHQLGLARERIHRVPVGCDHWRRAAPGAAQRAARILVLGALRAERSPLRVLAAFERLAGVRDDAELVFVGGPGDAAPELGLRIAARGARPRVEWRAGARESDLPGLLAGSALLVHLAREELTPVTPLEAFAQGLGVVASRLPAFEEALAGEALLVEPEAERDPAALAEALGAGLASGLDPRAAARREALAARFTWEAHARATLTVWRALLARHQ